MPPQTSYSHTCPRCGYDQSGLIATWQSSCPLRGTCSECGLEFEWADLLNAHAKLNLKFVEHSPLGMLGVSLFVSAWRTFAWTVLPWVFWRRVKLHHPIRARRWAVWLLLTLLLLHVISTGLSAILFLNRHGSAIARGGLYLPNGMIGRRPPTWSWADVQIVLLDHIARPIVEINSLGYMPGNTAGMLAFKNWRLTWLTQYWPSCVWIGLAVCLTFPILLALLPDTRRVAKVRVRHLLRGFVYSLAWLTMLAVVQCLRFSWLLFVLRGANYSSDWRSCQTACGVDDFFFNEQNVVFCPLIFLWLSLWWLCCIKQELKLNRPLYVWGTLMIPIMLVAVTVLAFTDSELWFHFV